MRFFDEQLRLPAISRINKDAEAFPQYSEELVAAMQTELELLVRDWVWTDDRPVAELLLSQKTFVNALLADFYGISGPPSDDDWEAVQRDEDDPRVGLLGAAGLLALNAGYQETSPTKRGRYRCGTAVVAWLFPEPPPGVDATLPEVDPDQLMTMRESAWRFI